MRLHLRCGLPAICLVAGLVTVVVRCAPVSAVQAPREAVTQTAVAVATSRPSPVVPTPGSSPVPTVMPEQAVLTICMGAEPASLHPYEDWSRAAHVVRAAIYDGPIDVVDYALRPVALVSLPSLASGDARIEPVEVRMGDPVINDAGEQVLLAPGVRVRPAGCRASKCAVQFAGESITMDQMQVRFVLRDDLRWANGNPVTAEDAVLGYELARLIAEDRMIPDAGSVVRGTATYVAEAPTSVVWTGLPGYLPVAYASIFWAPLPTATLRHLPLAELLTTERLVRRPLGYGPYTMAEWVDGERIELSRNPYYHGETPAFERVVFRFLDPADPDAAVDALLDGSCDLLTADLALDRIFSRLEALNVDGQARLIAQPGTMWEHLTFNVGSVNGAEPRPSYVQDVRTRQAVAYCLDRSGIVAEMTHGYGTVLDSYIPPDHPLHADEVVTYAFIPDRASALLDQAGWRDEDGDELREARGIPGVEDGTPLRIRYATTNSPDRLAVAELVTAQLANCGIVVDVVAYEPWEFYAQNSAGPLVSGGFDVAQFAWTAGVYPECERYTTAAIPSAETGWVGMNVGGFTNVRYDQACAHASWALPGEPDYEGAHHEAQAIFARTLPVVPLYRHRSFIAAAPGLQGVIPDAMAVETWNIEAFAVSDPETSRPPGLRMD